jgi:hypothetical protein
MHEADDNSRNSLIQRTIWQPSWNYVPEGLLLLGQLGEGFGVDLGNCLRRFIKGVSRFGPVWEGFVFHRTLSIRPRPNSRVTSRHLAASPCQTCDWLPILSKRLPTADG